jgi:hypothetical protein
VSGADQAKLAALERLWANTTAALDDETVHQKFVRFAVDNELYLPAIERYKALAATDLAHRALAEKFQKAIAAQAAARVFARGPARAAATTTQRVGRIMVAFFILGLVVVAARSACGGP